VVKRIVRKLAYILTRVSERHPVVPRQPDLEDCEFAHQWLNPLYSRLMARDRTALRPSYTWAMIQAAYVASNIGIPRISAIEFGVAGGNGLLAMERAAELLEEFFKTKIDVYGFDSARGLPQPQDYRDLPNLWSAGAYPMDEQKLRAKLKRTRLIIGLVKDTLPEFLASSPAPIGFISFDLDQYTSTVEAFPTLESDPALLMPRIYCHFDDILGLTYGHHNGERLAISEFNAAHQQRQISQIYGLRFYLPREVVQANWSEKMFMAHILDHPLYNKVDGLVCTPRMDLRAQ